MQIVYDKKKSEELMQRIVDAFGRESHKTSRGGEMHVSDLTGCQLKPYCRLTGVERKPTKTIIGTMVFGIVAENVLAWTFPKDELQYKAFIPMLEGDQNIFGHIDIFEQKEYPLEVKATRKRIFKAKEIPIYWVEQLMSYMSMHSKRKGWLVFYNILSTQIITFRMELTVEEILDWLIILNSRAVKIRDAARKCDPSILSINPEQYDFCGYKKTCPRRGECKEINAKMKREGIIERKKRSKK